MGLFDRSRQSTETNTTVTNISDDSTSVIQDAYNTISSTTNSFAATDSFKSVISQPIAILANGSDAFDANKFFDTTSLKLGGDAQAPGLGKFVPILIVAAVIWFGYKFFLRKR